MHLCSHRGWSPSGYRVGRGVATWIAVGALLLQVLLPFAIAAGPGADCPVPVPEAGHDHDPGMANSHGRDGLLRHSHTGGSTACHLRLAAAYVPPFAAINPPASPALALYWITLAADWTASAPVVDETFSRPLPRAPPLPV
jgi:hypothetical protein